jgi:E3 ubiquitin-protein ligase HECTD1
LPKPTAQPQIFKTSRTNSTNIQSKTKRSESAVDKYHRQLIELIRNKDTDAFIDLLDTNQIDINYMDDVGQTLLNWASAFGTAKMVEYLCKKNADVNRGQRSSSLHYAACFGRSQIVKILLNNGANPDLRDEDGKMALDKARERTEDGHRDVVQILQSSNEYLMRNSNEKYNLIDESDNKTEKFSLNKLIDDCETIADTFIRRLVPLFCNFYMNCMLQNINKCTLNILRKIIFYSNKSQIEAILNKKNNLIIELISKLLQETFNHDLILVGLNMSLDLIVKCQQMILNDFNR